MTIKDLLPRRKRYSPRTKATKYAYGDYESRLPRAARRPARKAKHESQF